MSALGIALIGFACFLAGLGIAYWFIKTDSNINAEKAENLKKDIDSYKADVNKHFAETARHFQQIGEQYRDLYVHMAKGAENLLGLEGEEAQKRFPLIAPAAAAAAAAAESAAESNGEVIDSAAVETEAPTETEATSELDETPQAIADGDIQSEATAEADQAEAADSDDDTAEAEAESETEASAEAADEDDGDTVEMAALDEDSAKSDETPESATVHVLRKASEDAA